MESGSDWIKINSEKYVMDNGKRKRLIYVVTGNDIVTISEQLFGGNIREKLKNEKLIFEAMVTEVGNDWFKHHNEDNKIYYVDYRIINSNFISSVN